MNLLVPHEEAEGLTVDLFLAWLERARWKPFKRELHANMQGTGVFQRCWTGPRGGYWFSWSESEGVPWSRFQYILNQYPGLTMPALLRQMNPRLHAGLPSRAARATHPALWLAMHNDRGYLVRFEEHGDRTSIEIYRSQGVDEWTSGYSCVIRHFEGWSFWPVDVGGNKIPWPLNAEGNPL